MAFLGYSEDGKSTTQNILRGLLELQTGDVSVNGYDLKQSHQERFNHIGVSFKQSNVYSKVTALENFKYYARK